VNSSQLIKRTAIGNRPVAAELELGDDERRIRRAMRLKHELPAKASRRKLPTTVVGGAALLAGGVCLGWKAFKFWHE
jgi:hypothetical protein